MKKTIKSILTKAAFALLMILAISFTGGRDIQAAEKYASKTYKKTIVDYSTKIVGTMSTVKVKTYYELLQLPGKTKAVKKINKTLKNLSKNYNPEDILSVALELSNDYDSFMGELCDYTNSNVVYNDGKYMSVVLEREWWAGGVSNSFYTGYTFDLSTGKRASITKITGKSLKEIKERIIANICANGEEIDFTAETINALKESDFRFYINSDDQCVVTFEPYEVTYGGWFREYIIE